MNHTFFPFTLNQNVSSLLNSCSKAARTGRSISINLAGIVFSFSVRVEWLKISRVFKFSRSQRASSVLNPSHTHKPAFTQRNCVEGESCELKDWFSDFPTYSPQLPNARPLTRQGSCLFSETIILCNSLRIAIQKIGTPSRYGVRSGFVNMKPVDKYWVQHQLRSFQGDSDFGTLLSLLTNTQNPPSSVMALEWRQ